MKKTQFNFAIAEDVLASFERVAAHDHMDKTDYARLLISRFSNLKPEYALAALTAIPKDYFYSKGGRPTTSASGPDRDIQITTDSHL